jgi:hypothetical protein
MLVSRIDLDGKGAGSPEGLVSRILKAEPSLSIPIPIEQLCRQLDISSIEYGTLDGLEGGLITNPRTRIRNHLGEQNQPLVSTAFHYWP